MLVAGCMEHEGKLYSRTTGAKNQGLRQAMPVRAVDVSKNAVSGPTTAIVAKPISSHAVFAVIGLNNLK
ncbi:hypothetical protein VTN96DRAFT_4520 [Rasamsonia emersonii]